MAVTRDGNVPSAHFAAGGSSAQPSLIEVQAAIDEAEQRLADAGHRYDRLRFAQSQLEGQQQDASVAVEEALARLHESDAAMAALAEQLGLLGSTARSAQEETETAVGPVHRAGGAGQGLRLIARLGRPGASRHATERRRGRRAEKADVRDAPLGKRLVSKPDSKEQALDVAHALAGLELDDLSILARSPCSS